MELHMYRCTELNANKLKQKTNLIYIEFGTCEVRCLKGTSGAIHTSESKRTEIDLRSIQLRSILVRTAP